MLQANVRFTVKLLHRISPRKLGDRTRLLISYDGGHLIAKVVRAVIPASVGTMCEKQMVNEPIIKAMTKGKNHKLAIRHQKHLLVGPA